MRVFFFHIVRRKLQEPEEWPGSHKKGNIVEACDQDLGKSLAQASPPRASVSPSVKGR